MRILCVLMILLALGGCMSIPNSPTARFYSLHPAEKGKIEKKFAFPSDVIIGIGPVNVPEYQNRPQIVTENKDKTLVFSEFNRWGQRPDHGFKYAISENLASMISGASVKAYPWDQTLPVRYQVIIDIVQLESRLDDDLVFSAEWSIINAQDNKMLFMKRSEFRQPIKPQSYSGLVETLNNICVSLSGEIAQTLSSLGSKGEEKKSEPAPKQE